MKESNLSIDSTNCIPIYVWKLRNKKYHLQMHKYDNSVVYCLPRMTIYEAITHCNVMRSFIILIKKLPLDPILRQINPVHIITTYLRYILILTSYLCLGLQSDFFHLWLSNQDFVVFCHICILHVTSIFILR